MNKCVTTLAVKEHVIGWTCWKNMVLTEQKTWCWVWTRAVLILYKHVVQWELKEQVCERYDRTGVCMSWMNWTKETHHLFNSDVSFWFNKSDLSGAMLMDFSPEEVSCPKHNPNLWICKDWWWPSTMKMTSTQRWLMHMSCFFYSAFDQMSCCHSKWK